MLKTVAAALAAVGPATVREVAARLGRDGGPGELSNVRVVLDGLVRRGRAETSWLPRPPGAKGPKRRIGYRLCESAPARPRPVRRTGARTPAGEAPGGRQWRHCLSCRERFPSEGPGHRMCNACRAGAEPPGPFDPGGDCGRRVGLDGAGP